MKKLLILSMTASITLLLSGCQATHLAYVSETSMGIDVALSVDSSTGRVVFGYDRNNFALVPRKGDGEDAMSLVSTSCIYSEGLNEVNFTHLVASGDAAKRLAKNKDGLEVINASLFGKGDKKCEQ